jgi:hypothetical protein
LSEAKKPSGYDEHRLEQRRWIARETTPQQRVQWLEDTLFMLWRNGFLPSKGPLDYPVASLDNEDLAV